jgi:hypothetical protein
MRPLLLLVLLLLLSKSAVADVIPPGYKSIGHFARFENLGDFPHYVFFAAHRPRGIRSGGDEKNGLLPIKAQRVDSEGATIGLGRNPIDGELYLLAVPRKLLDEGGQPTADWFDGKTPGVLQATIGTGYRSVPESEKRKELWTHLTVSIQDGRLSLTKTRDDKPGDGNRDSDSVTLPSGDSVKWYIAGGFGLIAVALLIGWFGYFKRK